MDASQFAQTREPDNLFEDEFVPVQQVTVPPSTSATFSYGIQDSIYSKAQPINPPVAPRTATPRGRDRKRGRGGQNKLHKPAPTPSTPAPQTQGAEASIAAEPQAAPAQAKTEDSEQSKENDQQPPQEPKDETALEDQEKNPKAPARTPAVRGDRLATGGIQRAKLTEDELTAKMAAAKLNNAKREAAHKLAEADQAAFEARESKARERRQEEDKRRKALDAEREKERAKRLAKQTASGRGREWDEGKEPETREPGRSNYRRGVNGVVDTRTPPTNGHAQDGRPRRENGGRGGYSDRGTGSRGRGGMSKSSSRPTGQPAAQAPPAKEEFPALPGSQKPAAITAETKKVTAPEISKEEEKSTKSWADQVEDDL